MSEVAPGDGVVVRAVLAGDTEQFGILVSRYREEFGRVAAALVGDRDDGADALQDAFIRAFESLDQCREPERFRGWFYRILANRCHDHRRRRRPERLPAEPQVAAADRADTATLNAELGAALLRALDRLTPEQREAFVLKEIEGRSYQEMADLVQTGVDALKMRVHRARDALRAHMEAWR